MTGGDWLFERPVDPGFTDWTGAPTFLQFISGTHGLMSGVFGQRAFDLEPKFFGALGTSNGAIAVESQDPAGNSWSPPSLIAPGTDVGRYGIAVAQINDGIAIGNFDQIAGTMSFAISD
jgi:hypothetical protein